MIPKSLTETYPGSRFRDLVASSTPGWSVFNPSVARGADGYKCIVRSSNFVEREGEYLVNDPENIVRTQNYLCDMDADLNITSMGLIDTSDVEPEVKFALVRDIEDARLFYTWGGWWYSGTSREHRSDGQPKIALDRLDGLRVQHRTYYDGPDPDRCEKNWMPLPGEIAWVYGFNPPTVTTGKDCWSVDQVSPEAAGFRGSSQVIALEVDQPCIGVVHEVTASYNAQTQRWIREYWHRFVAINWDGYLVGYSPQFYFMEPGIEFANGIVRWGDNLAVSFGYRDERAMLAIVPTDLVMKSITYPS